MLHTFSCCDSRKQSCFKVSVFPYMNFHCGYHPHRSLKITFSNTLRRIWSLPCRCHTGTLHMVAGLRSLYNTLFPDLTHYSSLLKSHSLNSSKMSSGNLCRNLVYTGCGYNLWYGHEHLKSYTDQDCLCASFIRDVRLFPKLNVHLNDEFLFVF